MKGVGENRVPSELAKKVLRSFLAAGMQTALDAHLGELAALVAPPQPQPVRREDLRAGDRVRVVTDWTGVVTDTSRVSNDGETNTYLYLLERPDLEPQPVTDEAAVTYYKAVRPDGCSFYDPDFRWLPDGWQSGDPIQPDLVVTHHDYSPAGPCASRYLSASTVATDCTGMCWPCVLLEVEPVGLVRQPDPYKLPHKVAAPAWRVIRELPAITALGPQGAEVAALIDRCRHLTDDDLERMDAAWISAWDATRGAARAAAWDAARAAAWGAARAAAWDAAWGAARGAARALIVRDAISREHYDELTMAWRDAIGPIHSDDIEARA